MLLEVRAMSKSLQVSIRCQQPASALYNAVRSVQKQQYFVLIHAGKVIPESQQPIHTFINNPLMPIRLVIRPRRGGAPEQPEMTS